MNREELLEIVLGPGELRDRDFKGPMEWDEKEKGACCKIVKAIIAFANSRGGWLVIGREDPARVPDPTEAVVGLTEDEVASWETSRVSRFVNGYVSPPVDIQIIPVTTDERKTCILVRVPPFDDIPHICQKQYPRILRPAAIYVRTANKESAEITDPQDMAAVVGRAVKNNRNELLRYIEQVLSGRKTPPETPDSDRFGAEASKAAIGFREKATGVGVLLEPSIGVEEVICYPASYSQRRYDPRSLTAAIKEARVEHSGWPLPYVSPDPRETYGTPGGIEGFCGPLPPYRRVAFWQLLRSGLFVHRATLEEDVYGPQRGFQVPVLAYYSMVSHVAYATELVGNLYSILGVEGEPLQMEFRLKGCKNRLLATMTRDPSFPSRSICRVDEVEACETMTPAQWIARRDVAAAKMIQEICMQFNFDGLSDEAILKDVHRAYAGTL